MSTIPSSTASPSPTGAAASPPTAGGWRSALVFAGGTWVIGMLAALLSRVAAGDHFAATPQGILPSLWPPAWVFWAVWMLIYPTAGIATWTIWQRRRVADVRGALALYGVNVIGAVCFLPISTLTGNNPAVLALMDLNGLLSTGVLAWLYGRYDARAVRWLLPFLVWMPLTTALKLWLWWLNR